MTDSELEALFASHKGVDLSDTPFDRIRSEGLEASEGEGNRSVMAYGLLFGLVGLWALWALFFAGKGGAFGGTRTHSVNAHSDLMVAKNLLAAATETGNCRSLQDAHMALGRAQRDAQYTDDMRLSRQVATMRRRLRKAKVCST